MCYNYIYCPSQLPTGDTDGTANKKSGQHSNNEQNINNDKQDLQSWTVLAPSYNPNPNPKPRTLNPTPYTINPTRRTCILGQS